MGFLGRLLAVIVMGPALLAIGGVPWATAVMGANMGNGEPPLLATMAPFLVFALLTLFLAIRSPTARIAWGRLFVIAALASFAMPLVGFAATLILGAAANAHYAGDGAHAGARAVGTGLAAFAVGGITAFFGLLLGLIFVIAAAFTLRHAPARN